MKDFCFSSISTPSALPVNPGSVHKAMKCADYSEISDDVFVYKYLPASAHQNRILRTIIADKGLAKMRADGAVRKIACMFSRKFGVPKNKLMG